MQFSPGMSQLDSDTETTSDCSFARYVRGRMPTAPVMAATGKEHDVSLQA
jgi:hypothetical protein